MRAHHFLVWLESSSFFCADNLNFLRNTKYSVKIFLNLQEPLKVRKTKQVHTSYHHSTYYDDNLVKNPKDNENEFLYRFILLGAMGTKAIQYNNGDSFSYDHLDCLHLPSWLVDKLNVNALCWQRKNTGACQ